MFEQQLHHIAVTLPAGQRERDVVLTAGWHVYLGSVLQEKLGHCEVTFPGDLENGGGGELEERRQEMG